MATFCRRRKNNEFFKPSPFRCLKNGHDCKLFSHLVECELRRGSETGICVLLSSLLILESVCVVTLWICDLGLKVTALMLNERRLFS